MDSLIIKRGLIVLTLLLVIIGSAVACNFLIGEDERPTVSNPDDVFMTYNGIEITNGDVYTRMKAADGMMQLMNLIDTKLLTDYMDAVTDDAIQDEILELTYETTDPIEIEHLTEAEKERMEQDYRDLVVMAGFDPDDEESEETFIRLRLAKQAYTVERYETEDDPDSIFYISTQDLSDYYYDYEMGDLFAIPVRFNSATEYRNVLRHFNLVEDYEDGWGLYTGDDPIEDVDEFDEDNTEVLDDDEVLQYYIKMYNYMNQHRDSIDENSSIEDLIALENGHFRYNQRELQELSAERDDKAYANMADYLYRSLEVEEEDDKPYSRESKSLGGDRFLFFVFDREEVPEFEEIDGDEILELRDRYIDNLVGDQQIIEAFKRLHEEEGLTIYDEAIAMTYQQQFQTRRELYSEDYDGQHIAKLDDFNVTVDEFFDYLSERIGALYATELIKEQYLLHSDYFSEHFGSNRNVFENRSQQFRDWRGELSQEKQQAVQFGIDWRVFFELQYGIATEESYLTKRVAEHLRGDYLFDRVDLTDTMPYVEDYYNNYFSLDIRQIRIYIDMNDDFMEDDIEAYLEELDESERNAFNSLLTNLEEELKQAAEDKSLNEIATEYQRALRGEDEEDDDYSRWARFKNAGIRIAHQNKGEMDYSEAKDLDEALVELYQDIYEAYQRDENVDDDEFIGRRLAKTQHQYYFVRAEKGPGFEKPSAVFDNADGDYPDALENDESMPSPAQLALYAQMRLETRRDGDSDIEMPDSVKEALEAYFKPMHDRFYSNVNFSILLIDEILEGEYSFGDNEEHHVKMFNTIRDLFYRSQFPELD